MSHREPIERQEQSPLDALRSRLVSLGNTAELVLADCVVALVERNPAMTRELRMEDCAAHEQSLEVDKLCAELLATGTLDREEIRYATVALKVVSDLKRVADEAFRIGQAVRSCGSLREGLPVESIPRMAELAQNMLGDAIEALVNQDPQEAAGLRAAARELAAINAWAAEEVSAAIASGLLPVPLGVALAGVAQRLDRIGEEALDICNLICHLSAPESA